MQETNQKIVTKEQTSFTELLDNREGIILDLENLHYFTLNGSAILIWKLLRSGDCRTADELSARVAVAFDLDPKRSELETGSFLGELKAQGLITYADAGEISASGQTAMEVGSLPAYEAPALKVSESLSQVTLSGSSTISTAAIATGGNG